MRIPSACCECRICEEAREKRAPYERLGECLFIEDQNILFDTPEDVNTELNNHGITDVKHIFYSHWHQDHTAGFRIIETLRAEKEKIPLKVYLNDSLRKDFEKRIPGIFYFESLRYCKIISQNKVKIGELSVELIRLNNDFAYAFLISQNTKKVVFCPCHSMHLPIIEKLHNPDLLIINLGYFGNGDERLTSFERDNLFLTNALKPKQTIFTHIEEIYGKSYDDYCKLEEKYNYQNIKFAFDGMSVEV